jgi:hypothetical protein
VGCCPIIADVHVVWWKERAGRALLYDFQAVSWAHFIKFPMRGVCMQDVTEGLMLSSFSRI